MVLRSRVMVARQATTRAASTAGGEPGLRLPKGYGRYDAQPATAAGSKHGPVYSSPC